VPVGCGGVAVFPGDVIVGDGEGVVVIPQGIVSDVARDAHEQEIMEEFVLQEIAQGRPLPGTYPPNAETLARYRQWRERRDGK
jgi:regulator of RNase E activity RraA